MKYNGKEYTENEILEILNTKDQEIQANKSLVDGANSKIKVFEDQINELKTNIEQLKIKNYDLLTQVNVSNVDQQQNDNVAPKLIKIEDLL